MNDARASESGAVGPRWIALAAAIGAAAMWFALSFGTAAPPQPATGNAVAQHDAAHGSLSTPEAPWPAVAGGAGAVQSSLQQPVPPSHERSVRREDTALPSPELGPPIGDPADYALDDATLSRRARTQFGLDCPGIAERRARRSGRFDVICTNGLRLRVNLMGDGPPGIAPIG